MNSWYSSEVCKRRTGKTKDFNKSGTQHGHKITDYRAYIACRTYSKCLNG